MALLYIREYTSHSAIGGKGGSAAAEPGTDQTPVIIGGATLQSAAFGTNTNLLRVHCDSVCSIVFGLNPTATIANARFAAGQTEYFMVSPGHKLAVIANT